MVLAAALDAAKLTIDDVPYDALTNGAEVINTAVPTSSHIRERAKWVILDGGNDEIAPFEASICWMSGANIKKEDLSPTDADTRIHVELATMIVLGRAAAWRMFGLTQANLKPAETHVLSADDLQVKTHDTWAGDVESALNKWVPFATRFVGIAWYNALSFEGSNHHHLPKKTKKLATTTISLLGLKEFFSTMSVNAAEGLIMHDMFHPLGYDVKAKLARNKQWAKALPDLNFGNLAKRIPIKAADCGLAFNYAELHRVANTYSRNSGDLPADLVPPAELGVAMAAYTNSADATDAKLATEELRAMSPHFAVAAAYLTGFILGKERKASGDREAELGDFASQITILGSNAIKSAVGLHPGAHNLGVTRGKATVYGWGSDDRVKHTFKLVKAATRTAVQARADVLASRPTT